MSRVQRRVMQYEELPPPSGLGDLIDALWVFRVGGSIPDGFIHVIVPDGAVSVSFVRLPGAPAGAGFTGPSSRAYRKPLAPDAVYAGVRLRPGRAGSMLGVNVQLLCDRFEPLGAASPRAAACLDGLALTADVAPEDLLALAAARLCEQAGPLDDEACAYADAIMATHGGARLGELAGQACGSRTSERQLRRRFMRQCGLSPKVFARLRRMRHVCMTILASRAPNLSQAANEAGFADQAHMTNEFGRVFGDSAGLVTEYLAQIRHGDFLKRAMSPEG